MSDGPDLHGENNAQSTTVVRTIILNDKQGSGAAATQPDGGGSVVRIDRTVRQGGSGSSQRDGGRSGESGIVSFDRRELDLILRIYGFKVADGEWKDYAIDMLKDRAIFSVYRRAHDMPLHCIEKTPKLARKQGAYSVTGSDGCILKRGHDLATVLRVLERKRPKLKVV